MDADYGLGNWGNLGVNTGLQFLDIGLNYFGQKEKLRKEKKKLKEQAEVFNAMKDSADNRFAALQASSFDKKGSLVGQAAYNALTGMSNSYENDTTNLALNSSGPVSNFVKTGIGLLTESSDSDDDENSLIPDNYSEYLSAQRKQAAGQPLNDTISDITSEFQQNAQNTLNRAQSCLPKKGAGGCLRKRKYQSGGWMDLANQGLNIASEITKFVLNKNLDKHRSKFQKISNNMQYPTYNYFQNNIVPKPYDLGSMPING